MKNRRISLLLAVCVLLSLLVPTSLAAEKRELTRTDIDGASYFRLNDLEAVSDIRLAETKEGLVLTENGLRVVLSTDSEYVKKDGKIIFSMKAAPRIANGEWYVPVCFRDAFLCAADEAAPSLFHGALFSAKEILASLYGAEDPVFSEKLLKEVLQPASMEIETPHLRMERIFVSTPLTAYSASLLSEMKRLGVQNPEKLSYSEYTVIEGAQTLSAAGMADVTKREPELKDADPDVMTVAEYKAWQRQRDAKNAEQDLSAEAKAFAEQKGITLSDLSLLRRQFTGAYMEQTDAALKGALTQQYAADLAYVQALALPFADVGADDWFFGDVAYVWCTGLMNGIDGGKFAPDDNTTRGMIMTILYRLSGSPAVASDKAAWWSDGRAWAMENGISDGTDMDGSVTREQLAAMLYRCAEPGDFGTSARADLGKFTDKTAVSSWVVEAMQWAVGAGVIGGANGRLNPQGLATRAEAAAMLARFRGDFAAR